MIQRLPSRRLEAVAAVAAVFFLLSACSGSASPPASPSGSSPASAVSCQPIVSPPAIIQAGTLTLATNATLPPLQYIDAQGNLVGTRVELGNELAKRMCLTPKWINIAFDAMIPGLASDRWDVVNTGMFLTPARAPLMEMIAIENQSVGIVVGKGNPLNIKGVTDLAGKRVAVEIGGFEEATIRQIDKDQQEKGLQVMGIQTFNTYAIVYQALASGQVDAVVSVDSVNKYYATQPEFGFEIVATGINPTPAALAMKNGNSTLAQAVKTALDSMKTDGYYDSLFDKYALAKITTPTFQIE